MKFTRLITLLFLLTILALTACSGKAGIQITDPWARPALKDGNGAAYLVLENNSGADDVLLSATTDIADAVELHDVVMIDISGMDDHEMEDHSEEMEVGEGIDHGGDIEDHDQADHGEMAGGDQAMKMVRQESIPLPAGETVTFKPGSFHVMLIGLNTDLAEGDTIMLTLIFAEAGPITIEVPVVQR